MPFAHGKPRAHRPGGCGAVPRARPGSARLPGPDRPSRRSHRQGRPVVPDRTALPAIATHRAATPFASACGALWTLRTLNGGTRLSPLSTVPSSFLRHSQTKAPSLRRRYPASPLLRAYPPPRRPRLSLAGSRWARARHRRGFPCCLCPPLARMPPPVPRRRRPVRASLASRSLPAFPMKPVGRPPHRSFRGLLGVHCALRPACSLSRPRRPFVIGVLQSLLLPPRIAPTASGWNDS